MNSSRRRYLMTAGAVTVGIAGLAGCLGDNGDDAGAAETSHECDITERDPVSGLPQPTVGGDDAAAVVEVFEDFTCPGCRDFALGDLGTLKDDYAGDDVRFEHYDFPVTGSDWQNRLPNAARSIQDEFDDETFYEFSLLAYENQDEYSWQVIGDIAEDVGADPCQVLSDANYGTYQQVIDDNQQYGQQQDVPGTPGVIVNGQIVDPNYGDVSAAIESNL